MFDRMKKRIESSILSSRWCVKHNTIHTVRWSSANEYLSLVAVLASATPFNIHINIHFQQHCFSMICLRHKMPSLRMIKAYHLYISMLNLLYAYEKWQKLEQNIGQFIHCFAFNIMSIIQFCADRLFRHRHYHQWMKFTCDENAHSTPFLFRNFLASELFGQIFLRPVAFVSCARDSLFQISNLFYEPDK